METSITGSRNGTTRIPMTHQYVEPAPHYRMDASFNVINTADFTNMPDSLKSLATQLPEGAQAVSGICRAPFRPSWRISFSSAQSSPCAGRPTHQFFRGAARWTFLERKKQTKKKAANKNGEK